jgi:glycosyltransferase involved in cell wall biosynthesis
MEDADEEKEEGTQTGQKVYLSIPRVYNRVHCGIVSFQFPSDNRDSMKLSIIVPVYNEKETVRDCLTRVVQAPFDKEIIVVDDASTDGTQDILKSIQDPRTLVSSADSPAPCQMKCIFKEHNEGKGAAVNTAMSQVTGDITLIQDADLEYSPTDYPKLVQPILDGNADVVYGSRFTGGPQRVFLFWHFLGNKLLTLLVNICADINLSDMETGYKVFRTEALKKISLKAKRFDFDPEITIKVAQRGLRIYEVPISYAGRDYKEGKKIGWKDGFAAIGAILRYSIFK